MAIIIKKLRELERSIVDQDAEILADLDQIANLISACRSHITERESPPELLPTSLPNQVDSTALHIAFRTILDALSKRYGPLPSSQTVVLYLYRDGSGTIKRYNSQSGDQNQSFGSVEAAIKILLEH